MKKRYFNITISSCKSKLETIKLLKWTCGLSLGLTKAITDSLPCTLQLCCTRTIAYTLTEDLRKSGCIVQCDSLDKKPRVAKPIEINGLLWDRENIGRCFHRIPGNDSKYLNAIKFEGAIKSTRGLLMGLGKRVATDEELASICKLGSNFSSRTRTLWLGTDSNLLSKSKHSIAYPYCAGERIPHCVSDIK